MITYLDPSAILLDALLWYAFALVGLAGIAVLLEWTRR